MALNRGPRIVTNGLTLCLDAANRNSYPGSGNTWYDLSGNRKNATMSVSNSPVFTTLNGVSCFGATDLTGQNFSVANYTFPTTGRTYECWVNHTSVNAGYQTWMDDNLSERVFFGLGDSGTFWVGFPGLSFASQISANVWTQVAFTMVGDINTTVVCYKNGSSIGSGTYAYNLTSGTGTLYLMGDTNAEIMSGYMAITRVYNRVLSASEVLQNFNATRRRFGI